MVNRKNTNRQKPIKSEKSGRVFSDKNTNKSKLSEQWYQSLLESFSRFKKEFIPHPK